MSNEVAHKSWWQIFEVVFGVPFIIALVLQRLIPFSFPRGIFTPVFISAGVLLLIVGIILVVLTRREFAKHGQPTDPGQSTSEMITTGVFSISRNPLYLGGILLLAGISLAFNLPWALILLLPSIVACHFILIAPEEKYLAVKFGEKYRLYTAAVHRWFGSR
jgi:protein-S-isoprenylcysteine O-methyltransferase Ste14